MTSQQNAEYAKAPVPYGKAVTVLAEALINHRWGEWSPEDGYTEELWNEAREGDLAAAIDDMAVALQGLEAAGLIAVDWDDDDLQDCGRTNQPTSHSDPENEAETRLHFGRPDQGGDDA
jgi:hypothetical protein